MPAVLANDWEVGVAYEQSHEEGQRAIVEYQETEHHPYVTKSMQHSEWHRSGFGRDK